MKVTSLLNRLFMRVERGLKRGFVACVWLRLNKSSYTLSLVTFMTDYSFRPAKRSDEEMKREYHQCRQLEYQWRMKLRKPLYITLTPQQGLALLKEMCNALGVKRHPRLFVYQNPGGLGGNCCYYEGHYNRIVISHKYLCVVHTLLHELAHHIIRIEKLNDYNREQGSCYHGADYLWVLDMLYQAYNSHHGNGKTIGG